MRPDGHGRVSDAPDGDRGGANDEGASDANDWDGRAARLAMGEGHGAAARRACGEGRGRTDEQPCCSGARWISG
jgi:hypothetical protein